MVNIGKLQTCLTQTIGYGACGKSRIVLLAREALLLHRRDDLAVAHDRFVVIEERFRIVQEELDEARPEAFLFLTENRIAADEFPLVLAKEPLDAGFHYLPDRLLAAYRDDRAGSSYQSRSQQVH